MQVLGVHTISELRYLTRLERGCSAQAICSKCWLPRGAPSTWDGFWKSWMLKRFLCFTTLEQVYLGDHILCGVSKRPSVKRARCWILPAPPYVNCVSISVVLTSVCRIDYAAW